MSGARRPNRFPRRARLTQALAFTAVRTGRARVERGPLTVQAIPAADGESRLGLSIGRRYGPAVARNRLKRRMREIFRTTRGAWPGPYDVVVSARAHEELSIAAYRELVLEAINELHALWTKRADRGRRSRPAD